MPEETTADKTPTESGDASAEGDDEAAGKKRSSRRDFGDFAVRELRRARRLSAGTDEGNEAAFAVQLANVAALLDVADAIRGVRGDDGEE